MFERFTNDARKVVLVAQETARMLGHEHVGPEHLLLGVTQDEDSRAAGALAGLGVTYRLIKDEIVEIHGEGTRDVKGSIPFLPNAKKALELSLREALSFGDKHIGSEHILLGIERVSDDTVNRVFEGLGVDPERVRSEMNAVITGAVAKEGYDSPVCAYCESELAETLSVTEIEIAKPDEGGTRVVEAFFCRMCGKVVTLRSIRE